MSSTWTLPDDLVVPELPDDHPGPGSPMPQHWSKCLGCGDEQPTGLGLTFTLGEGPVVTGRFEVAKRFQGGPGFIHGGILMTAFDEAQGMACNAVLRRAVVTGHMGTDFKRPIPLGAVLEFTARVEGTVRRKVYTSAEARIVDGPFADPDVIVGTSHGLFIVVGHEHFEKGKDFVDGAPSTGLDISSV
ncbi:MAG: PaaI family thioesterase [Rhodococcus sp.]|uniref:PaaI family thioesterase n=1 Tax=Rhodococcus TaxID=1827 RepID=UPI00168F9DC9|nr:PaaI family thioesterase [Rhodococcus sp. (in: high G+C Gram-positive bacteria)]NLV81146.1 PaaI family thioesterase [Rhodococcus sp. (in: high G+C Gram-positive bacteria)]